MKLSEMNPLIVERAREAARNAIGNSKTFRLSKKSTVSGTILECEPARVAIRNGSAFIVFRFVLECGTAKVRREFFGEKVPG